jgi:hypothetical protein
VTFCGCGTPLTPGGVILFIPPKIISSRRHALSTRVPLCARHWASHQEQARQRWAAWCAQVDAWYTCPRPEAGVPALRFEVVEGEDAGMNYLPAF